MASAIAARGLTVDEFLELPDFDRYELVDGEPREDIGSAESVWVGGQALHRIAGHLDGNPIGFVLGADQLFALWPSRPKLLRKPDVSVVPSRLLPGGPPRDNVLTVVPALVVEVNSPSNNAEDVFEKVLQYLEAGVKLVWVIYPPTRMAQVFRADRSTALVGEDEDLDGEDVLPGFKCLLSKVLPPRLASVVE